MPHQKSLRSTVARNLQGSIFAWSIEDLLQAIRRISQHQSVLPDDVRFDFDTSFARGWRVSYPRAEYETTIASAVHSRLQNQFGFRLEEELRLSLSPEDTGCVVSALASMVEFCGDGETYHRPDVDIVISRVSPGVRYVKCLKSATQTMALMCRASARQCADVGSIKLAEPFYRWAIELAVGEQNDDGLREYVYWLMAQRRFKDASLLAASIPVEGESTGVQRLANCLLGGRLSQRDNSSRDDGALDQSILGLLNDLVVASSIGKCDPKRTKKLIKKLVPLWLTRLHQMRTSGQQPPLEDYALLVRMLFNAPADSRRFLQDVLREGFIWGATNERGSMSEYLELARTVRASEPSLPMFQRLLGTVRIRLATAFQTEEWCFGEAGLAWASDHRASHEAVCPVCGSGGVYGSGDRTVTLDVWFDEGGPVRTINRAVRRIQLRCERQRPTEDTSFPESKSASASHSLVLKAMYSSADNEWRDGRTTMEYLSLIQSPLADHPTIKTLPILADPVFPPDSLSKRELM